MSSSTGRQTAISLTPPRKPRLRLQPDRSARTLLDGGWWPRSADPAAELPGLILALDERHGSINRIMLGMADWDSSRPRRLRVDGPAGSRVARLGWFAGQRVGLLTATSARASEPTCKRMGAITVEVPAGHVAMVSHPDDVAQLIKTAAEAVQTVH